MNVKLVESLVQAIESLPPEDYALFQEQLATRSVQKTPGICGGHARIRSTRIPIWTLISLQHQGADDEELLHNFPGLTPFDLTVARAYYASHSEEIDSGDLFFPTADEAAAFDSLVRTGRRKLPWRYKWPEAIHDEVLARLLDLNQQRHLEEVRGHKAVGTLKQEKTKGTRAKKKSSSPQANAPTIPGLEI